jgi:FMN phosphatase YigB (HAD superfamily)
MMKQILSLMMSIFAYSALSGVDAPQPVARPAIKPAIVFDLHGVLTNVAPWKMAKAIGNALLEQPSLIFKMNPATFSSGEYAKYPALRAVYNSHTPNEDTFELARNLKAAGHQIYLFTNAIDMVFAEFSAEYPGYFVIFDGVCTVHADKPDVRKPTQQAFAACKALIAKKHPDSPLILIDNKQSNITAAQATGFSGILFSSAEQAQKDLAAQGVTF